MWFVFVCSLSFGRHIFFWGEVHNKNVSCLSDFSGDSRTWAEHHYSRRHLDTFWTRTGFGSEQETDLSFWAVNERYYTSVSAKLWKVKPSNEKRIWPSGPRSKMLTVESLIQPLSINIQNGLFASTGCMLSNAPGELMHEWSRTPVAAYSSGRAISDWTKMALPLGMAVSPSKAEKGF